ncbi:unnamed protein product, partial [marine sediment metagenome]
PKKQLIARKNNPQKWDNKESRFVNNLIKQQKSRKIIRERVNRRRLKLGQTERTDSSINNKITKVKQ